MVSFLNEKILIGDYYIMKKTDYLELLNRKKIYSLLSHK